MREIKLLSVVVPCHNEQEVILESHKRLAVVLERLLQQKKILNYEIIYVDNGSTDRTLEVLKGIFKSCKQAKIVVLRRNFGFQGSLSAGLFYTEKADAVITIDADLQDPPEKIEEMVSHYIDGYDMVLGVRENRCADSFLKRFTSNSYYKLLRLLGVDIVLNHADFRLMAQSLVKEFNSLTERNRFIRAMVLQLESRYAVVYYKRQKRLAGNSKFNLASSLSLGLDGIISFSFVPLRLASLCGVFIFFLASTGIAWVLYIKITTNVIVGWASILLPVLALGGIQLLFLGLIGEYIGKMYIETKHRPLFLVRNEYSHN